MSFRYFSLLPIIVLPSGNKMQLRKVLYSSPGRTFYFLSQRSKNFHLEFNDMAVELYECNELSMMAGLTY